MAVTRVQVEKHINLSGSVISGNVVDIVSFEQEHVCLVQFRQLSGNIFINFTTRNKNEQKSK